MEKKVSRKEFLRYLGIILLSLIGITNILNNLQQIINKSTQQTKSSRGYGMSAYGK